MTCTGKVSEMEEEQGKEIWHENKLTKREMEALTAFCDTILPVVDVSDSGDEDLIAFYGTSASMLDAPDKVGRLISGEIYHPACGLLRIALLLLSTWYGTFFMCGLASLSKAFPYFQKFAKIGQPKREEILLSWSLSSFYLYKMLFKCIKYLTARVYFAEVNQKNSNPSWKAIGYCGPDLSFVNVDKSLPFKNEQQNDKTPDCMGPIHSCLLHIHQPIPILSHLLHLKGFPSPTTTQPLTLHCDAVVVGSGSGGSVVAGILASSGYKVLLLEKGQYFPGPNLSLLEGPTSKAMYEGKSIIATDDIGALLLAGSTLGGGSTINWSASIQTPKHVRDEWCDKHGLLLFGSTEFDHALDEVCEKMGVQNEVREEGFNNAVLRKGCEELGFDVRRVPINAPPDHYCGWCHLGCKDGKKKSTLETWLKDFAKSGNGFILLSCRATKVMHKKALGKSRNRAYGIMAETEDKKLQFLIESKVTVIASGALNTPGLLKRSGLKNPNIGKNLHIHPCAMGWGYFPAEPGSWPEASKRSYQGGILTSMSTQVANFDASGYGAVLQTPALHPSMFATLTPWISAADYRERMLKFSRTAHIFALVRDKGSGTVDYPLTVTHRLNPDDEENLGKGLEVILKVLVAAGAEEVGTHHCGGERVKGRDKKGLERLIEGVKKRGFGDLGCPISSAHQMGSCRMGAGPEEGAVGPRGETWEVEGLFVADTSVFPTALGVNPMVTVQAIAYCVAQSVVEVLKRKV